MEAIIIGQKFPTSTIDYAHGGGAYVRRLLIRERGNLIITLVEGRISACIGFDEKNSKYDVLGSIEIPEKLADKALALAYAQQELDESIDLFETLVSSAREKKKRYYQKAE